MSKQRPAAGLDTAQATIEEAVIARWQQWRTWLTLSRERLTLREEVRAQDEDAAAFDLDDATQAGRLREIEAQLAAVIPAKDRQEFQAVYDAQLAALSEQDRQQGGAARDTVELERMAYDALLAICQGDPATNTPGQVPMQGRWYRIDTAALRRAPKAASFTVAAKKSAANRTQTIVGVVAIVVLLIGYFVVLPALTEQRSTAAVTRPVVGVNGASAELWQPIHIAVVPAAGEPIPILIRPVTEAAWPSAPAATTAGWRAAAPWPLELCLPRAAMPTETDRVQLHSAGGAPVRTYQLAATRASAGSEPTALIIRDCGGDERLSRYGTLIETTPLPLASLGEAQVLPGTPSLTVEAVQVRSSDHDAGIPAGRVQIAVRVRAETSLADWNAVRPEVTLATGVNLTLSAPPTRDAAGQTVLTFLAPAFATPTTAIWQVSDLASGEVRRWRLPLPVPQSRLAYLGERLQVEPPQVVQGDRGTLAITLRMTTDGEPLPLRDTDIRVQQGAVVLPIPAWPLDAGTVFPDRPFELTIEVTPPQPGDVTVTVGRAAFDLVLPQAQTP